MHAQLFSQDSHTLSVGPIFGSAKIGKWSGAGLNLSRPKSLNFGVKQPMSVWTSAVGRISAQPIAGARCVWRRARRHWWPFGQRASGDMPMRSPECELDFNRSSSVKSGCFGRAIVSPVGKPAAVNEHLCWLCWGINFCGGSTCWCLDRTGEPIWAY